MNKHDNIWFYIVVCLATCAVIIGLAFTAASEKKTEQVKYVSWFESSVTMPPENVPFVGYWVDESNPMTPPVLRYGDCYYLYTGSLGQQTIMLYNRPPIQWINMPGGE